jgi:hypothetical protein
MAEFLKTPPGVATGLWPVAALRAAVSAATAGWVGYFFSTRSHTSSMVSPLLSLPV